MTIESARSSAWLFVIATGIWGSTWLAIKFQLGSVAPEVSVAYRFALAAAMLALACLASGRSLRLTPGNHLFVAAQGAFLFGFNYVAVYWAEQHVPSGLVAVIFSTIVFMNPIAMRIAFGTPITIATLIAAALGVCGVSLLFLPELRLAGDGGEAALGIGYALAATLIASIGNVLAVRNNRAGVGIWPGTAWGMAWGACCAAAIAIARGLQWSFDARLPYVASLAYLALCGSVFAFLAYLTLLKRVGAGPAAFVGVSTPVLAMVLSTLFEDYRWSAWAVAGVVLAVAGNILALRASSSQT